MADMVIPYKARPAFQSYHDSTKRFCCTVAHRRAGKTVARINKLIISAIQCPLNAPRFAYIAPYYVQAKDIAWQYLKHYTASLEPLGRKVNESELSITLEHNGAVIRLYGAENAERLRGVYADGIVLDEAQGMVGSTFRTVILPCLSDRKGWLDVSGTPKGWENLLGEIYKLALANQNDWFVQTLKASTTGILPQSELDMLSKAMLPNQYAQELECSFDAAIEGAVYGEWMTAAQEQGRIMNGLYDPALPVHTAWDLGYDDATAIVFYQLARGEVRIIDYCENNQQDIPYYCELLKQRGYKYDNHYVPHDAANKLLAAGGRSIVQQAFDCGVKMRVIPSTTQQNSISAARAILPRCWFDETHSAQLISSLKQYQFEYDERNRVFRSTPKHDWSSHGCFIGSTKVLTRNGTYQIMNLPQTGEVLTSCGWKKYENPRTTRKNAPLVEVIFENGFTVRCTPDHLFKTELGWISAENLRPNTEILSTWMNSRSILMAVYTGCGLVKHTYRVVEKNCIEKFGGSHLARYLKNVIYTTKTVIQKTISLTILSVLMPVSILEKHGLKQNIKDQLVLVIWPERRQRSGTPRQKEGFGISVTQSEAKTGIVLQRKLENVLFALENFLQRCVIMQHFKNIAVQNARSIRIRRVKKLDLCDDVWCLTVPNAGEFALSNGALVHNCDAFELIGRVNIDMVKPTPRPEPKFLHNMTANDLFWPQNETNNVNRRI